MALRLYVIEILITPVIHDLISQPLSELSAAGPSKLAAQALRMTQQLSKLLLSKK